MPREDFVKEYMDVRAASFKPTTIKQAFKKSGMYPINPEVFTDTDFAPSISTSTSACFVPASYPVSDNNIDNDFYATDEDASDPNEARLTAREDDSDAEDSGSDEENEATSQDPGSDSNNIPMLPPPIHDPFGFLTDSQIWQSETSSTSSTSLASISTAPSTSSMPSCEWTPVPPESFYALPGPSRSQPHLSTPSASSLQRNSARPTLKRRFEQLEERVAQLESEAVTMRAHLSMAHEDIQGLKQKQNARDNRSRKRPKLNVDARTLTLGAGHRAAAEKEVAKELE